MKITRILAYRVDLPLHEGSYKWSGGKSVAVFDSTIVRVETDAGIVGHGEVCPLGPFYLAAYANGVRAGLVELGPHLLGENPLELAKLNRTMDAALKGHAYVKSPIDMACWDILGKATQQPVCTLLGGRYGEDFVLYRAISQESAEQMAAKVAGYRAEGYRRFQLKVGGLTKARQARDLCVSLGIAMTLEDSWGGDIVTAAIAHLAHSTPPEFLFTATDFNSYVTVSNADGAPKRIHGRLAASATPGLGIAPRKEVLGKPVVVIG